MVTVWTVGHSTRPIEEFVALLQAYRIRLLVDIRTIPRSRHNPQFESGMLAASLAEHGIEYRRLEGLGGLRRRTRSEANAGWRNASFRGYADHMQTAEFVAAVEELITWAAATPTMIMCAEAVPWRCHRSLVGDALLIRGIDVLDVMSPTTANPHRMTRFARVDGLTITYPTAAEE